MKFDNMNLYIIGLIMASVMMGCSNNSQVEAERVGYLVTLSKNDIYYKCGNKEDIVNKNGKFSCSSFPVGFYRDTNNKIGSISSLHNDGFVFPQDMQLEEDSIMKIASR
ncbi:hypothetical protein MNB_SV-12-1991 [hydrothermal vent metagenome]|uniref:Lipoprotein n=1 Tax=hydrothermal vent metagenome TaxID=652676 RepID=A0A1W1BVJ0_9ZZZZ